MSGSIYLWLTGAILVFWCVGVYNRLMRLRARGFAAFGSLDKHLQTFSVLLQAYAYASVSTAGTEPSTPAQPLSGKWAVLVEKVQALELAGKAARGAPLQTEALASMALAMDAVLQEWQAISSEPADLAGSPVPDAMRVQWEDASTRAQAARGALNQLVLRYNEAMQEFPARLIVGLLGFRPAGRL